MEPMNNEDCPARTVEDTIFPYFHANGEKHGRVGKWHEGEERQ